MRFNPGMKACGWAIVGLLTAGTARAQDGSIVGWGWNSFGQTDVPAPKADR